MQDTHSKQAQPGNRRNLRYQSETKKLNPDEREFKCSKIFIPCIMPTMTRGERRRNQEME